MMFSGLAKICLNFASKRYIRRKTNLKAWPNDWVPFHWSRPEKVPGYLNAGDLVDLKTPDKEDLQVDVRNSQELRKLSLDNPIRKIFSLDHARRSHHNKAYVFENVNKLGIIHDIEYTNSLEARIINNTFAYRQVVESFGPTGKHNMRYNGHLRMRANTIKYRRYRQLCELKELHADRWARLIKTLNIEPEENLINVKYYRPYRKIQMRLLAQKYARDLREKKVEEYLAKLEKEKIEFEKEKKETMAWIEEQEKKLGMTV